MSATVSGVLFPLLFLVLFISSHGAQVFQKQPLTRVGGVRSAYVSPSQVPKWTPLVAKGSEMVPLIEAGKGEKMMMMLNETRRKLGSFQICALCTCCGGAKGYCLPTPCCYAINCNIPNRPFGYCSFTPKTCNCFGCHY